MTVVECAAFVYAFQNEALEKGKEKSQHWIKFYSNRQFTFLFCVLFMAADVLD